MSPPINNWNKMLTKHHVYVEIVKDITPRNLKRKTLYQDNTKTKKISNTPPQKKTQMPADSSGNIMNIVCFKRPKS